MALRTAELDMKATASRSENASRTRKCTLVKLCLHTAIVGVYLMGTYKVGKSKIFISAYDSTIISAKEDEAKVV